MKATPNRTTAILALSFCFISTGCLQTRAQLRADQADDGSSPRPAAMASPQPAQIQDVQQGSYALDEIKGELTRLEGRIEDLERNQRQSGADAAAAENKDEIKKLEGRVIDLEQAQTQVLEILKKIQDAQQTAAQAAVNPSEALNKGKRAYSEGNYDAAIGYFSSVLKGGRAGPEAQEATFLRAESYFAQKKYKKAIVDYSKFPEKYSKSKFMPAALYRIGLSFDALGMRDDAQGFYQDLVDKFPRSSEARRARKKLKG